MVAFIILMYGINRLLKFLGESPKALRSGSLIYSFWLQYKYFLSNFYLVFL